MVNLDDPAVYRQYDPERMLDRIHELPAQCRRAWEMAKEFQLPPDYSQASQIVILGMGGSAIGGDLVSSLVIAEARLPVMVWRDYRLPAFVDENTLVITSSYSGMTEETLSAFEQALKKTKKRLVITTGGRLKIAAESEGVPVFHFDYKAPPRAALPYSLFPILGFLQKLGFVSDKSGDAAETIEVLDKLSERLNEQVPLGQNPAKELANRLFCRLPVIYGSGITAEVAHRWKTQLNENSKSWAFYEVFPELNHNAIVGYQFPVELSGYVMVVMLRSRLLSERVLLRYRVTGRLLEQAKVAYQVVDGEGNSPLSQVMSLVLLGDYVSYYLALLYQTDPSPVKVIDYLKKELGKGPGQA